MPKTAPSELMTPEQLSEELQVGVKTLANWRSSRVGPPYLKVRGAVRYRRETTNAWLCEQERLAAG